MKAAGAPLWACARKLTSTANRTNLFNDTTADNFITGVTIGLFNYADGEAPAGCTCRLEFKNNWFRRKSR